MDMFSSSVRIQTVADIKFLMAAGFAASEKSQNIVKFDILIKTA